MSTAHIFKYPDTTPSPGQFQMDYKGRRIIISITPEGEEIVRLLGLDQIEKATLGQPFVMVRVDPKPGLGIADAIRAIVNAIDEADQANLETADVAGSA